MSSHFTCRQIWEQSKWKKLNCEPVCDSRLSLTSQMGCNCLINPMFVSFYAFSYGLFSLRAISSADLPSLGECLCQKHSLPDQLYFAQDFVCCLSREAPPVEATGAVSSSTPFCHAAAVSLVTFSEQLSVTVLYD